MQVRSDERKPAPLGALGNPGVNRTLTHTRRPTMLTA